MVLVKINTPVHYHVKKYRICKNKICQIPGTFFDGNMVVSAGMAHIMKSKGSHGSMSLALRSYGSPLALALFTFSVFGIASESDVVGPGGVRGPAVICHFYAFSRWPCMIN